jgi:hypothetical protein
MTFTRIDVRIDAAAKELVEMWIQRTPFEDAATNLIPRKRWQMTHVEKKRMPPNYRLGQQSVISNQTEQLIAPGPSR